MGEDEPDQQRLLLARGGRAAAGTSLGPWRTTRSLVCGPIRVRPAARSRLRPLRSARRIAVLRLDGAARPPRGRRGRLPGGSRPRGRAARRPGSRRSAGRGVRRSPGGRGPRRRPSSATSRSTASSQRSSSGRSSSRRLRERRARSIAETRAPCAGIDRQHEAVEEPAPVAGGAAEQPVEVRGQPDHPEELAERHRRGGGGAVDAAEPARAPVRTRRLQPRAEPVLGTVPVEGERHREPSRSRRCAPSRRTPRGAGRGPARTARSPRAGWSCRRRSRRPARRSGPPGVSSRSAWLRKSRAITRVRRADPAASGSFIRRHDGAVAS